MLVQTSIDGSGTAVQANARAAWVRGRTLLLSPGLDTQLEFDGRFAQQTVRSEYRASGDALQPMATTMRLIVRLGSNCGYSLPSLKWHGLKPFR